MDERKMQHVPMRAAAKLLARPEGLLRFICRAELAELRDHSLREQGGLERV
jgi:hypothetical protein